jgi:beta-glucosidase
MRGGQAVAELALGLVEPSGRLPISFAAHAGQQPTYYNQIPGQHGDRYADLTQRVPFAFGEGLSYTTVQLYLHDLVTSATWAAKELKGFLQVELAPGGTATVDLELPVADCTIVDSRGRRVVEPGTFALLVGPSSRDEALLRADFTVKG